MKQWHDFIASQILAQPQPQNTICALTDSGILYVGGDDAQEFLQNQLSNDISHIDSNKAQLSSFSNAKGRMIAIFRVIQIDGGYLLIMPRSILQDVMQQLQKYIVRSQVVLADITETFAMLGIAGDSDHIPQDERFPEQLHQVYQSDSLISVRVHSSHQQSRFLILTNNADEAISLVKSFGADLSFSHADSWRLQEIEAAVPTLYPETMQAFVLQMSNLQLLDGVSFKKGCYPGQEVVARMQYLGKLKRRMYLAEIESTHCPKPGDGLQSKAADKDDGSGKVVDAVQLNASSCLMLFIAQSDKAESDDLVLTATPDATIKLQPLPYSWQQ